MRSSIIGAASLLSCLSSVAAQTLTSSSPTTEYTLTADGIQAIFIPYGARLQSCIVADRNGDMQDIAVGYDNSTSYPEDTATNHTYFGAVVGRFANRIKNSTFTLDGNTYHIPPNENDGMDTLHGGTVGYDARNWTVLASNDSSVSMALLDTAFEGFPGTVLTIATYSVESYPSGPQGQMRPRMTTQLISQALDTPTPIMLSNHIYWNLNAFKEQTVENDTYIWMPYSTQYIQTDGILIPNGTFGQVSQTHGLDFTSPKLLGDQISMTKGYNYCGDNCTGVDNAFIVNRPATIGETSLTPVMTVWSNTTGIEMTISTNQVGIQLYTCNGQNGTIPVKQSQQQRNNGSSNAAQYVNKYGCYAIEPQAYIDGINNQQWPNVARYEIFTPQTPPSVNHAVYDFSTVPSSGSSY